MEKSFKGKLEDGSEEGGGDSIRGKRGGVKEEGARQERWGNTVK